MFDKIHHVLIILLNVAVMCSVAVSWIGRATLIVTVVTIAMNRSAEWAAQCRVHARSDLLNPDQFIPL